MTEAGTTSIEPDGPRHELRDVDARSLMALGAALCVTIALTFFIVSLLMGYLVAHQPSEPPAPTLATTPALPRQPSLQVDPSRDLAIKRAAADAALGSYGWVDRSSGTVRIPIERAMELLATQPAKGH